MITRTKAIFLSGVKLILMEHKAGRISHIKQANLPLKGT